jgi:hypothetical protein
MNGMTLNHLVVYLFDFRIWHSVKLTMLKNFHSTAPLKYLGE